MKELKIICVSCDQVVQEPGGALLLSPPYIDGTVSKIHLCHTCWSNMAMEHPFMLPKVVNANSALEIPQSKEPNE